MSTHQARILWSRASADFTYASYNREHDWHFKGGVAVRASAAPQFKGSADCPDPEDAFVASLASCHMLTFLAVAAQKKFTVDRYEDAAVGHLEKNARGKLAITRVELHPQVTFGADRTPTAEELHALHERAHAECFIANSVLTEVTVIDSPAASAS
jgi:organic hydroperoxide reductase OsmC/OhrA